MPTYYANWAAFELPDARCTDRTTHLVEIDHPDHPGVQLVVYRGDFPEGKTLRQLVAGRVAEEMARLDGYGVIESVEVAWADAPAVEITSRWRHDGKAFYQRQAHLVVEDAWTYFALSGPFTSREVIDGWLAKIRASLRVRSDV